jgi:hypothetical protein
MKYSDAKHAIQTIFAETNQIVPFIKGSPGGGKSALGMDVFKAMGIPDSNILLLRPSLRDSVDFIGVPRVENGVSHWSPPQEIHQLQGDEKWGVLIDELSDAAVPVQNVLCGMIYDREIGEVHLGANVFMIATGNRTIDKSGANKIVSKLSNRTLNITFDNNLDDWCEWALDNGIDHLLIQFLRFKPNLLNDFDPDRPENPTQRQWEKVSMIPTTLSSGVYLEAISGLVGPGAAAEYCAFRQIAAEMPSVEDILMDPEKAVVPTKPATLYALTGAIAHKSTKDNFDRVAKYVARLKPEFGVMLVNDAQKLCPAIKQTKAFVGWAVKNSAVLL